MSCKGICKNYKTEMIVSASRYGDGKRRCQTCEIFIYWDGLWCPCCGYRLRIKPRSKKAPSVNKDLVRI